MATLTSQQLKDSYQSLVTIGDSITSDPTSGQLENGKGTPLTAVGIGTNSPDSLLQTESSTDGYQIIAKKSTNNAQVRIGIQNDIGVVESGNGSASLAFRVNNDEKMRIKSTGDISFRDTSATEAFYWDASLGRLGIGTGTPDAPLDVESSGATQIRITTSSTVSEPELVMIDGDGDYFSIQKKNRGVSFRPQGSEAMRIDNSGNVGIGTDSPANILHIQGASDGGTIRTALFENDATAINSKAEIMLVSGGNTTRGASIASLNESASGQPASMIFSTSSAFATPTERMRIDSSGNVGIGTDSPDATLHIANTSPSFLIDDTDSNVVLRMTAGSSASYIQSGTDVVSDSAAPLVFGSIFNTTEWMRIDSSGNVLVAQNSTTTPGTGNTTVGISLRDAGAIHASRDGNRSLYANRNTSDGPIISVQKDGTEVGSIGTRSSGLTVGSGDVGLFFDAGVDRIFPESISGSGARDNAIDLGTSSARFKDLYLGGSVYLGGTTSANALDDYEEGTWTATLTAGTTAPTVPPTVTGKYTKIGNVVTVIANFSNVDISGAVGTATITGLPFTCDDNTQGSGWNSRVGSATDFNVPYINSSNEVVFVNGSGNALDWTTVGSGTYTSINITFRV